jgi:hypothetical protein
LKRQPEKKAGILREVLSHRQMQAEVAWHFVLLQRSWARCP